MLGHYVEEWSPWEPLTLVLISVQELAEDWDCIPVEGNEGILRGGGRAHNTANQMV